MAFVCICNAFNEKQVGEGIKVKAENFPAKPTSDDVYQLYHDVYEWCGLEYKDMEARPKCERCFAAFIDNAIDGFLAEQLGVDESQALKTRALDAHQTRKQMPRVA